MEVNFCYFDTLFTKNVPHILEKIFLTLDYESFKECLKVNNEWKELITSERFMTKAKSTFKSDISEEERKLLTAARQDNLHDIKRILSSGMVDVNCREIFVNSTPLNEAASNGNLESVKILLERGANHKNSDRWGITPLHEAAHHGHEEIAQILIGRGGNLDVADREGRTPLHEAASEGHKEVAQLLIESGANPKVATGDETPLHSAVKRDHKEVVKLLLRFGADPNVSDHGDDLEPMHYAITNGNREIARLLIENGADKPMQKHFYKWIYDGSY